jgi:hypothetical protein
MSIYDVPLERMRNCKWWSYTFLNKTGDVDIVISTACLDKTRLTNPLIALELKICTYYDVK